MALLSWQKNSGKVKGSKWPETRTQWFKWGWAKCHTNLDKNDRRWANYYANPSEVQCILSRLMMSLGFLLLSYCADLATGDQLIVRRTYPNAPESESFTGDTSRYWRFRLTFTWALTREISPQLSPEKWTWHPSSCPFSKRDKRVWVCIPIPNGLVSSIYYPIVDTEYSVSCGLP